MEEEPDTGRRRLSQLTVSRDFDGAGGGIRACGVAMGAILGCVSSLMIWLIWWVHYRGRRRAAILPSYRLVLELLGVGIIAITGHLGGFHSGVNGPG